MNKVLSLLMFIGFVSIGCKAKQDCMGAAKPDMMCTMQYDPVCGCDGKTYGNACSAEAAGVLKWSKGECK